MVTQGVWPNRCAKGFISGQIAVGIEHGFAHLGAQAHQSVQSQWQALKILQAFVDPAHARTPATGQDQSGDVLGGNALVH